MKLRVGAEGKVTLIKLSLRRGERKEKNKKADSFSHRSVRGGWVRLDAAERI